MYNAAHMAVRLLAMQSAQGTAIQTPPKFGETAHPAASEVAAASILCCLVICKDGLLVIIWRRLGSSSSSRRGCAICAWTLEVIPPKEIRLVVLVSCGCLLGSTRGLARPEKLLQLPHLLLSLRYTTGSL